MGEQPGYYIPVAQVVGENPSMVSDAGQPLYPASYPQTTSLQSYDPQPGSSAVPSYSQYSSAGQQGYMTQPIPSASSNINPLTEDDEGPSGLTSESYAAAITSQERRRGGREARERAAEYQAIEDEGERQEAYADQTYLAGDLSQERRLAARRAREEEDRAGRGYGMIDVSLGTGRDSQERRSRR